MSQLARMSENQKPRHSASSTDKSYHRKQLQPLDDIKNNYLKELESNQKQPQNGEKPIVIGERQRLWAKLPIFLTFCLRAGTRGAVWCSSLTGLKTQKIEFNLTSVAGKKKTHITDIRNESDGINTNSTATKKTKRIL